MMLCFSYALSGRKPRNLAPGDERDETPWSHTKISYIIIPPGALKWSLAALR